VSVCRQADKLLAVHAGLDGLRGECARIPRNMRIAVLGAGSWGTALAILLADGGHEVTLWGRDPAGVEALRSRRENVRYLPGRRFPDALVVTGDVKAATAGRALVVVALPSSSVRQVARAAAAAVPRGSTVVCASKGLEEQSCLTMDRVLTEEIPHAAVALLSGPTFALEIAAGLPGAAVAASTDSDAATLVQGAFAGGRLRIYTTEDVVGVAIGGALKNVIAIAAGCSDGLGFGSNARAALVTRGLHEIGRLATRMGGNPLTLAGLAGLGDLVLTCTGELSRNRRVGLALAAGEALSAITARLGQVAEGVHTALLADELARRQGVEMPITTQVAALVSGRRSPRDAVADLLAREQGPERG
jgi:glycerol-3-phosphate dehydrogenase (NAD(P)+)